MAHAGEEAGTFLPSFISPPISAGLPAPWGPLSARPQQGLVEVSCTVGRRGQSHGTAAQHQATEEA